MSEDVVDLAFAISGRTVAGDPADALHREIAARLPWLDTEPAAGILPLKRVSHGEDGLTYLSRHSRLILRLPRGRVAEAARLSDARLDLGGEVTVGEARPHELTPAAVLYSPFVTVGEDREDAFLEACGRMLAAMGISVPMLCGKPRHGSGGGRTWSGFSLMLYGLSEADSLTVQRRGLGGERLGGCGNFVPHKSVVAVGR